MEIPALLIISLTAFIIGLVAISILKGIKKED